MVQISYLPKKEQKADKLRLITHYLLHTRQFAKRQRTWFRKIKEINWFDANDPELLENVWQKIQEYLVPLRVSNE